IQHGLNPNDPADALADADGDGRTNLEEFLSGTDPRRAGSGFQICTVEGAVDRFILRFTAAVTAEGYTVEYRDSLTSGAWSNWTNISAPAFDRLVSVTNLLPGGLTTRAYRVIT